MQSAAGEAEGRRGLRGGREREMVGVGTPEVAFFLKIYLCFHVLRCLFPFLRQPEKPAALVCSGSEERRGEQGEQGQRSVGPAGS